MDEVEKTVTRKLEHTQQEYKAVVSQREFIRAQLQSVNDRCDDLEDEMKDFEQFLKRYAKDKAKRQS